MGTVDGRSAAATLDEHVPPSGPAEVREEGDHGAHSGLTDFLQVGHSARTVGGPPDGSSMRTSKLAITVRHSGQRPSLGGIWVVVVMVGHQGVACGGTCHEAARRRSSFATGEEVGVASSVKVKLGGRVGVSDGV